MQPITLYHYWRSSCSWRVRWALAIKNINYQDVAINLLKNEQRSPTYLKLNPSGLVPTLDIDGMQLSESLAIIEYLEDRFSNHRPLLPQNRIERAKIREVANILMTIQSVQNLRVLKKHSSDPVEQKNWAKWVIEEGLMAVEKKLQQSAGTFCFGGQVSMADLFLVPQVYNAHRFSVDMNKAPTCQRIYQYCLTTPECDKAAPHNQPGAIKPAP